MPQGPAVLPASARGLAGLQRAAHSSRGAERLGHVQARANSSDRVADLRALSANADDKASSRQIQLFRDSAAPRRSPNPAKGSVLQLLTGAAPPIAGLDVTLPMISNSRAEAAEKIAKFVNLQARTPAPGGGEQKSSALGANIAGNLYVRSNYHGNCWLETWLEMTPAGGGYVKRVRVHENNDLVMDRVINDAKPTDLNKALMADAVLGAKGGAGLRRYSPVHGLDEGDTKSLEFRNGGERDADNITKVVGEGARFGWLAGKLANRKIGNTSQGILRLSINFPQMGSFSLDPTFQQLWGSWDSAFGRAYMKDIGAAKAILQDRLHRGLRPWREDDAPGNSPLDNGRTATGPVTSLRGRHDNIVLMPVANSVDAARIITDLGMTWKSER